MLIAAAATAVHTIRPSITASPLVASMGASAHEASKWRTTTSLGSASSCRKAEHP
jgi:hypothetical protein